MLLTVPMQYFFCESFFLCLVFLMLSHLFIAALWSSAGKGLTMALVGDVYCIFVLYHVASWVRCGI